MRSTPSKTLILAAAALLAGAGGRTEAAQTPGPSWTSAPPDAVYPDSPGGKRARAFVEAFNTGDRAAITKMIAAEFDANDLKRFAAEPRAERWTGIATRVGAVDVKRVVEEPERIVLAVVARRDGKTYELSIDLADPPARGILGADLNESTPLPDAPGPGPRKDAADFAQTVRAHLTALAAANRFSGVILVARGEETLIRESFGFADRAAKTPTRVDTKFRIGSLNKRFTAVAIGQLLDAGKITLDDPVTKHIPEYPKNPGDRITIRHLVTMTSGLGDFGPAFQTEARKKFESISDYLATFVNEPLRFEPGASRGYSNAGYVVLGRIIEKVTGRDYYDFVHAHITAPAGMTGTASYFVDETVPNRARHYFREPGGELRDNAEFEPRRGSSAGGGWSIADDLLRFQRALLANRFTHAPTTDWIIDAEGNDPKKPADQRTGRPARGWAGGSPGQNAVLFSEPATNTTIVILSNLDPPSAEGLLPQIRDWLPR